MLDAFRREAGVEPAPDLSDIARGAAEASLRAALEAARARVEELSREVGERREEASVARAEAERLARELEKRPQAGEPAQARAEAEERARKSRLELEARCASLEERLTLMGAERVRLESLRRKAEATVADRYARRAIEDIAEARAPSSTRSTAPPPRTARRTATPPATWRAPA